MEKKSCILQRAVAVAVAVASACGLCVCAGVRMPVHVLSAADGICGWTGSGCPRAFSLSACPCVLRGTCGFSVGVWVTSVCGFLCVRGGVLKEELTSKSLFQTSTQGPRLKVKMMSDV